MWETQVLSLGWEDPLEKEMAAHSSTLAWKTPWTEEPSGLQSMGSHKELDTTERLHHHHQSLLRLMSIESVMPPNRLILRHPLLLLPSIFPSIRVFSKELALCIRWPEY